jgi:hypothetical protein
MSLHVHVDLQTHMPFLLMPSLKSNFCLKLHCKPLIIFVESRHQSAGGIESRFTGNVCRGCWHSRRLVAGRVSESRAETTAWWRLVVQVQGTPEDREGNGGPTGTGVIFKSTAACTRFPQAGGSLVLTQNNTVVPLGQWQRHNILKSGDNMW